MLWTESLETCRPRLELELLDVVTEGAPISLGDCCIKHLRDIPVCNRRTHHLPHQNPFLLKQPLKDVIKRMFAKSWVRRHRYVDRNVFLLSNAVTAIIALVLDGWVPPSTQMNDMISCSDIEPHSGGSWRKHQNIKRKL